MNSHIRVRVHCPECGQFYCDWAVSYQPSSAALDAYRRFILKVHREVEHKEQSHEHARARTRLAMPADEKWQRVAVRIGVWAPSTKCPGCLDPKGHRFIGVKDGEPLSDTHDIPCPDPSDPAMFVVMTKYILEKGTLDDWDDIWNSYNRYLQSLDSALIDGIDALPEK
jgi:hypothetical protein